MFLIIIKVFIIKIKEQAIRESLLYKNITESNFYSMNLFESIFRPISIGTGESKRVVKISGMILIIGKGHFKGFMIFFKTPLKYIN